MLEYLENLSLDKFDQKTFLKGTDVLDYLKKSRTLGIIVSGEAKVYYHTIDNKILFLNVLRKNDILGLTSTTSNEVTTQVICKTELKVKVLKEEVMKELWNDLEFNQIYIRTLNSKINFLLKKIRFLTTADVKLKVLSFLVQNEVDGVVHLQMSKSDLIYFLNVSKASLFNELGRLRDLGLIDYKNRVIKLLNKKKILQIMEDYK